MAEIVNLKAVRKQADRAKKRAQADANAAKFGRTKVQRQSEETEAERSVRRLDGHRIETERDE